MRPGNRFVLPSTRMVQVLRLFPYAGEMVADCHYVRRGVLLGNGQERQHCLRLRPDFLQRYGKPVR